MVGEDISPCAHPLLTEPVTLVEPNLASTLQFLSMLPSQFNTPLLSNGLRGGAAERLLAAQECSYHNFPFFQLLFYAVNCRAVFVECPAL